MSSSTNGVLELSAPRHSLASVMTHDEDKAKTRAPRRAKAEPKTKPPRKPRTARQALRASGMLRWAATAGPCGLAVLLLGVSMPHLADGFQGVTGCGPLAGWLLAVAVDAAQVVAKLQLTLAHHEGCDKPEPWQGVAMGIVGTTCLLSCAMNVLAFLSGATTFGGQVLAVTVGILLPLLILALSYTGSCFALRR